MKIPAKITSFVLLALLLTTCADDTLLNDLTDDRDQFLGTWDVTETCAKNAYAVNIVKDPSNSSQVIIENFRHITVCSNPPFAIIAGTSIVIPEQEICSDNFPYTVEGNGKLNNSTINLNYYYKDEADSLNCSAQYMKQK